MKRFTLLLAVALLLVSMAVANYSPDQTLASQPDTIQLVSGGTGSGSGACC